MRLPFQRRLGLVPQLLHQVSKIQTRSSDFSLLSRQLSSNSNFMNTQYIDVSEEVRCALFEGKPVVTLETAILTHGMPNPTNVETALRVQEIVRENGAVPATIGIIKGRIKVGLDDDTLIRLGTVKTDTFKTSYRDLPFVLSQKLNGGTTVSTTLTVSKAVDVPVMVTGGIGGVHRGGETTMDISADLVELGCTPVGVVCSGVKSILDIERTLEFLETQGVLVASFGPTKDFPAFYSRESGQLSPYNVNTSEEAAGLIHVMRNSRLRSGLVIAVPVPQESAIPRDEMEEIIKVAVSKANESGIRGKEITPYVLSQVAKSTAGRSLSTNVALIQNNAAVGAKIAVDLAKQNFKRLKPNTQGGTTKEKPDVMVIGGAVVDNITKLSEPFKVSFNSVAASPFIAIACGDVTCLDHCVRFNDLGQM
ncbi:pseudouridine-5'-phosphate glycosidase-like [Thrips palmi]|uniref:Pseudouridine-5'-phosphate glycosidase-like n=1 Tax=Thrips palmi TaxID=161013 RepID=A0A6P8YB16_THRPL|nr:pseudouridine-5'-phosphate glycosidase-like [Thrips palmi]